MPSCLRLPVLLAATLIGCKAWAQNTIYSISPDVALPKFVSTYYNKDGQPLGRYPDFSLVGMPGSLDDEWAPDRKARNFYVKDYGAIANDGKDDVAAIQAAVDAAGKAGGGVVVFGPGQYDFDVETTQQFVKVRYSNIILRGNGAGGDGTQLFDHHGSTYPDKSKKWLAGLFPSFFEFAPPDLAPEKNFRFETGTPLLGAPQHANQVVAKGHHFLAGQYIALGVRARNENDSSVLWYCTHPSKRIGKNLAELGKVSGWKVQQLYQITKVAGDTLTLDAPLLVPIKPEWEARIVSIPMLTNIGVEGFRMVTSWSEDFWHHKSPEHDNGFDGIKLRNVANSFVRVVEFVNVSTAIGVANGYRNTVMQCRIKGNRGHNGYVLGGISTRNLFKWLDGGTQMHTFSFNGSVSGNVLYRCSASEPAGLDCHGGLGLYNLVDNLKGCVYASGGGPGNTPPGIGTGLVLYNWQMGQIHPYKLFRSGPTISTIATPGAALVGVFDADATPVGLKTEKGSDFTHNTQSDALWLEYFGQPCPLPSLVMWLHQTKKQKK